MAKVHEPHTDEKNQAVASRLLRSERLFLNVAAIQPLNLTTGVPFDASFRTDVPIESYQYVVETRSID
ncbi:MAG: hypothetical protein C4K47_06420 [Candidatus Thorarchaeota archaeon]|nr:MAG: hypothetical protein C4K47_06420 [Candidatus Thorarchaeota archaeon]